MVGQMDNAAEGFSRLLRRRSGLRRSVGSRGRRRFRFFWGRNRSGRGRGDYLRGHCGDRRCHGSQAALPFRGELVTAFPLGRCVQNLQALDLRSEHDEGVTRKTHGVAVRIERAGDIQVERIGGLPRGVV
jgi:hypothetical protein